MIDKIRNTQQDVSILMTNRLSQNRVWKQTVFLLDAEILESKCHVLFASGSLAASTVPGTE